MKMIGQAIVRREIGISPEEVVAKDAASPNSRDDSDSAQREFMEAIDKMSDPGPSDAVPSGSNP